MSYRIVLLLLFSFVLFEGCKDPSVDDNDNVGSLQGTVTLLGVDGLPLKTHEGAMISLEGTSYHATTDAYGKWVMENVAAGVYNVVLVKDGFDTTIIPRYHFTGAGTAFINGPPDGGTLEILPRDSVFFSVAQMP